MARCDRLADDTPGRRHHRDNRLAFETKPSVGFQRGLKRGRIFVSPVEVCTEKKKKRVAMSGFVKMRCLALMEALIDHPYGEVFRDMDTLVFIPTHGSEYMKRLTKRVDLSTIKSGLEEGEYSAVEGFVGDVRLVFSNAFMFFPVENDVHKMAERMGRYFEIELKKAMSEINTNAGENVFAIVSDSGEGAKKAASFQGFNANASSKRTGATPPRAALLKERFKETILKAETSLHHMGPEMKLKEMTRKREREAAREALEKMEKTVTFSEIDDRKAFKELEYLCGCPLPDASGRKILSRLGLHLRDDEDSELD